MPGKIKDTFKKLSWPRDREKAKKIQAYLRQRIIIQPLRKAPACVAGVDAAFLDDKIISTACLYKYPELTPVEESYQVKEVRFPYIPGMLSFREGPAIIACIEGLKKKPDLIIFDGQGIAHPLGLGIAATVGMILDIPSIGCAKTRLVGEYKEPGVKKGSRSPLKYEGRIVGAVLRTQTGVKPIFVSPGHRIDLEDSIEILLRSTGKFRLPEPVRNADILSKKIKRLLSEKRG